MPDPLASPIVAADQGIPNPYLPLRVRIDKITVETDDRLIKTFRLVFGSKDDERLFSFTPGQFSELSVAGKGESPIGMASSPTDKGYLEFTVMRMGVVTSHLHGMEEGEEIGIRGPLGNWYPLEEMKGKHVVIIGGGFAFTTLRSTTRYILHAENRSQYGDLTVIYGARSPGLLIYKDELREWEGRKDLATYVTVDKGDETWKGREGFVPTIVGEVKPSSKDAYALVCGPPIMIKFTIPKLLELGFPPERIITSLEMRMKCGFGMCGRCNIGPVYVCKDGPVFSYAELKELPQEY
jgi:NAD(P)H-flavin reductase